MYFCKIVDKLIISPYIELHGLFFHQMTAFKASAENCDYCEWIVEYKKGQLYWMEFCRFCCPSSFLQFLKCWMWLVFFCKEITLRYVWLLTMWHESRNFFWFHFCLLPLQTMLTGFMSYIRPRWVFLLIVDCVRSIIIMKIIEVGKEKEMASFSGELNRLSLWLRCVFILCQFTFHFFFPHSLSFEYSWGSVGSLDIIWAFSYPSWYMTDIVV